MLTAEPDPTHMWCVRDTRTGRFVARRITEAAACKQVDAWVRKHSNNLVVRDPATQAEAVPAAAWKRVAVVAWATVEGEWVALVSFDNGPPRWVPAGQVRPTAH